MPIRASTVGQQTYRGVKGDVRGAGVRLLLALSAGMQAHLLGTPFFQARGGSSTKKELTDIPLPGTADLSEEISASDWAFFLMPCRRH